MNHHWINGRDEGRIEEGAKRKESKKEIFQPFFLILNRDCIAGYFLDSTETFPLTWVLSVLRYKCFRNKVTHLGIAPICSV